MAAATSRKPETRSFPAPLFHTVIKAERTRRGWTQREMATFVGVSQSLVARWEQGSRSPSREELTRLGYLLRITWTLGPGTPPLYR